MNEKVPLLYEYAYMYIKIALGTTQKLKALVKIM